MGQFPRIRPENVKGRARQAVPSPELEWDSGLTESNIPELSAGQRVFPWIRYNCYSRLSDKDTETQINSQIIHQRSLTPHSRQSQSWKSA